MVALEHPEALENLHKDFQHAGLILFKLLPITGIERK